MDRVVGHLDLDYFYAQVEEVENPAIRNRPVIVCVFSGRTEDSGVVSTANYSARKLGVDSGMPIVLAKKKLQGRDPVVIKMIHEKYEVISDRIMQAVGERVDAIEQTGIDEAFFDLTDSSKGDYLEARSVAEGLKESILHDENLTCSIGIGRSKIVAKLGSDMAKPGGLVIIIPESTEAFLDPLPVTKLYGVGPKTASALEEMRIKTIGELSRAGPPDLERRFGKKLAAYLLRASTGTDYEPVHAGLGPTQYSRVVTLKQDSRDPQEAFRQLADGVDYVQDRLATSKRSFRTLTAVGILTDLTIHTKSKTFETPVNDATTISAYTLNLLRELSGSVQKDFRRVGLRVSGLVDDEDQKSLSEFLQPTR